LYKGPVHDGFIRPNPEVTWGANVVMNQSSLENAELGTSGKSLMNTQNEEKLKV
jgi:hypothetical protein